MSAKQYDVVGVGNAIVDVITHAGDEFLAEHALTKGAMTLIDADRAIALYQAMGPGAESSGGSAANTIYGLAKLGIKAGFVGAVGDDPEGKASIRDFKQAGVDTRRIKTKAGVKTGSVLCLSDQSGNRSLYVMPGANSMLSDADLDVSYATRANILHITSFANEKQFELLNELPDKLDALVKISFSPGALYASKGLAALIPILRKTHVLFINHNELRQVTGKSVVEGAEICLSKGCKLVVVTMGKGARLELRKNDDIKEVIANSYIRDVHNEYAITSLNQDAADAVDTTGAGDAYAAGFIYGLINLLLTYLFFGPF